MENVDRGKYFAIAFPAILIWILVYRFWVEPLFDDGIVTKLVLILPMVLIVFAARFMAKKK